MVRKKIFELKELKKLKILNFFMLFIAGVINAFGVNFFLAPVNLYDSGISGTSILLDQLTPEYLTLSLFLLLLNIPLFLFGLRKFGLVFTIYSIFTVCIYSLGSYLINDVLPVDVSIASPLAQDDLLLCSIFGGILSGVGSGLAIRFGGSLDGIEVVAVAFSKRLGISVGTFVMIYNVMLYFIAGLVSLDSWILPLYSIIAYYAGMKTVDFIVEGLDRAKSVMIITEKPDEISRALMDAFGSGTTKILAKGGYSNANKTVIYFVVNRFQISKLRNIISSIDKSAYVTVSEVADVFNGKK